VISLSADLSAPILYLGLSPGAVAANEKKQLRKYLQYLQSVKNSSPHTILNYRKDLEQFLAYLSPPGARPPALTGVAHPMIREFVAHLHDHGLAKSSIARKLAALRSFFKYCVREGRLKENPARLVPTPKLPKRIPSVVFCRRDERVPQSTGRERDKPREAAARLPQSALCFRRHPP